MNSDASAIPWTNPQFAENQRKYPVDALLQFQGQHIAWSWDGSRVVASAASRVELDQKLRNDGIDPLRVVHDFVENPDLSYLNH